MSIIKYKKIIKIILCLLIVAIFYTFVFFKTQKIGELAIEDKKTFSYQEANRDLADEDRMTISNINYNESTEIFSNPERGFYTTNGLRMLREGSKPTTFGKNSFVQLKVDISDFSGAQNGDKDYEFTASALEALDKTLENAKNTNSSIILRFEYDKNCDGIGEDEGVADYDENGNYLGRHVEPEIEMVEHHMEQLRDIFYKYSTTIYNVQVGLFGSYGELHSSTRCTDENVSRAVKAILDNSPKNITVSVRTPMRYAYFTGIDKDDIDKEISVEGTDSYRVGMFNDGYLGSGNDLGSFSDREKAYKWLTSQATHVPYGGEALPNYDNNAKVEGYTYMNKYSIMPYCEQEMYKAHTSYLNYEWDQRLHKEWQETPYDGKNELYRNATKSDGNQFSDYDFINIHLGYRLVLRDSKIKTEVNEKGDFNSELTIENVGFAPIIKDKKTRLIFVNENDESENYKVDIELNVKDFSSNETVTKSIYTKLPDEMKQGDYKVYLQIYSEELEDGTAYLPIRFANEDVWNSTLNANYIGNVKVSETKKDDEAEKEEPDENEKQLEESDGNEEQLEETNENEKQQEESKEPEEENQDEDTKREKSSNTNNIINTENNTNKVLSNILPNTGESNVIRIILVIGISVLVISSFAWGIKIKQQKN